MYASLLLERKKSYNKSCIIYSCSVAVRAHVSVVKLTKQDLVVKIVIKRNFFLLMKQQFGRYCFMEKLHELVKKIY